MSLWDYIAILKRRRYHFLLPAVLTATGSLFIALSLPATYLSTATLMVEDQDIPEELLSTFRASGVQRVPIIQQQILTTSRIEDIVERMDLFQEFDDWPRSQVAELFRSNVLIDFVDAEMTDPESGRPIEATIAFVLGFFSEDPQTAQKVTDELVSLFLQQSLRSRSSTVSSVSEFFGEEAEVLAQELSRREAELAAFKEANSGALPELYQYNLGMVERTGQQIQDLDRRTQENEQRIIELTAELAQLSPYSAVTLPSGEVVMSDQERLRTLELEYRRKSNVYSDEHPDLRRLQREIQSLRESLGVGSNPAEGGDSSDLAPNNPGYVFVNTQLQTARAEARSIVEQRRSLSKTLERFEELVRRSPQVEREYQTVVRGYESAAAAYSDLKSKQTRAQFAMSAEEGKRLGQFTVLEPANFPMEPESPNRRAIVVLGSMLAGLVGIAFVVVAELMDTSVRGAYAVAEIVGSPPIISVPYIANTADYRAMIRHRTWVTGSTLVLVAVVLLYWYFVRGAAMAGG